MWGPDKIIVLGGGNLVKWWERAVIRAALTERERERSFFQGRKGRACTI